MISWQDIDTVFLDMDGTLLDLYYDNHFWMEYVPACYAREHHISVDAAKTQLHERYAHYKGSLNWYCLDFWTEQTQLPIVSLKEDVRHLIAPRPYVFEFLKQLESMGKQAVLATNAHPAALKLKLREVPLAPHFDAIVSSHELGAAKEDARFWERLQTRIPHDPARSMMIDDSLPVLRAARAAGIGVTLAVRHPDSRNPPIDTGDFHPLECFSDLMEKSDS